MFDLIIVGAGPAGATLAARTGGLKTLVLEKRPLERPQRAGDTEKCCGGLLAPDAQRVFAACGYALDNALLCSPQTFLVRALDLNSGLSRAYQRFYANMDREKFDRFLFSRIAGCDVRTGCTVKDVRKTDVGFEVEFLFQGRRYIEQGRFLACADGAGSLLRRKIDPASRRTPLYIAISQTIGLSGREAPFYGSYFDNTITDYYAWTIPKDGFLHFGAALYPGANARAQFEALKSRLIRCGIPLDGPVLRTQGAYLARPCRVSQIVPSRCGAAFLGECGGFISSSSAEGISYAIQTGLLLAEALRAAGGDPQNALHRYERSCAALKAKCAVKMVKGRALYHPLTRRLAMQSGLTAIKPET